MIQRVPYGTNHSDPAVRGLFAGFQRLGRIDRQTLIRILADCAELGDEPPAEYEDRVDALRNAEALVELAAVLAAR